MQLEEEPPNRGAQRSMTSIFVLRTSLCFSSFWRRTLDILFFFFFFFFFWSF